MRTETFEQAPDIFPDPSGFIGNLNELSVTSLGGVGVSLEVQSEFVVPDNELPAEAPFGHARSGAYCSFGTCPKQDC